MTRVARTARRSRSSAEDRDIVARLRSSEKERAENIMIVDLVRNDLARLAVPGGVRTTGLCRPERYRTVRQLTSDVTARLHPTTGLADIFRALFPCGSVTGAPKHRTMGIIRELEPTPAVSTVARSVWTHRRSPRCARFSVAIRTLVADRTRGTAEYGAGGGITWNSSTAAEYAEPQAKAAILPTGAPTRPTRVATSQEKGTLR